MSDALVLKTPDQDKQYDKIELFTIEETGQTFYIVDRPRLNVSLKFVHLLKRDQQAAIDYLLEAVLGLEAYEALMDYEDLDDETFSAIVDRVSQLALGNSGSEVKEDPTK